MLCLEPPVSHQQGSALPHTDTPIHVCLFPSSSPLGGCPHHPRVLESPTNYSASSVFASSENNSKAHSRPADNAWDSCGLWITPLHSQLLTYVTLKGVGDVLPGLGHPWCVKATAPHNNPWLAWAGQWQGHSSTFPLVHCLARDGCKCHQSGSMNAEQCQPVCGHDSLAPKWLMEPHDDTVLFGPDC